MFYCFLLFAFSLFLSFSLFFSLFSSFTLPLFSTSIINLSLTFLAFFVSISLSSNLYHFPSLFFFLTFTIFRCLSSQLSLCRAVSVTSIFIYHFLIISSSTPLPLSPSPLPLSSFPLLLHSSPPLLSPSAGLSEPTRRSNTARNGWTAGERPWSIGRWGGAQASQEPILGIRRHLLFLIVTSNSYFYFSLLILTTNSYL